MYIQTEETAKAREFFLVPWIQWIENHTSPVWMIYGFFISIVMVFLYLVCVIIYNVFVYLKYGPKPYEYETIYINFTDRFDYYKKKLDQKWTRKQAMDKLRAYWGQLKPQRCRPTINSVVDRQQQGSKSKYAHDVDKLMLEVDDKPQLVPHWDHQVIPKKTWYIFRPKTTPRDVVWVYSWPEYNAPRVVEPEI
ncbi:uncharacterized protein CYBJADRAFT_175449 [Cyberlindnera jadinii NRRL Y-1542]|uniref:Uncharacterized protein n=1 Tax=Cyberlindnera jadinii (strain ATCC 18201 / CBS 1600 / BCRC 20928 / JCM 3617 / NBRC 0987 / NRRL Y-1542) TaxID=983966 RepID=A0A1E4RUT9_CYBJN|nr:hypothetical protein CYBJADRAFT_175449 [Cyberlindnera jadinii NRRL Y-1542]ODV71044.1 hypothetical protein CYBJADRAFT_175449 [Cyberlindnera jadinii NRRL Y-1542]